MQIRRCCMCSLCSSFVFISVSTAGSVRPPALPARCARVFVSVCAHVRVCMQEKETGLSYGLHAVTKESRLWDIPGCQEHPPPTLYRLTAYHSSVWIQLQSDVYSASTCHLETAPSASSSAWYELDSYCPHILKPGLPMFIVFISSEWEPDRLTLS